MQKKLLTQYLFFAMLACAAMILLMPFVSFGPVIYGSIFPKVAYVRTLTVLFTFLFLWHVLSQKGEFLRHKEAVSPVFVGVAAYFSLYFFAGALGVNAYKSFWGTMERGGGIITAVHLLALFLLLVSAFRAQKHWDILWQVFLGTSIAASLSAIGHKFGFYPAVAQAPERAYATFGNPTFLASYSVIAIFLSLLLFSQSRTRQYLRFYSCAAIFFASIALFFSGTRGAMLGAAVGILAFAMCYFFVQKSKKKRLVFLSGLLVLVVGALFVVVMQDSLFGNDNLAKRILSIHPDEANVQTRLLSWEASWHAVKDRWFLGWGPENYDAVYNAYISPEFFRYSNSFFDRPHNELLGILVDGGIVLFLGFAAMIAAAVYNARRALGASSGFCAVCGLITAYIVQNMFAFDTITAQVPMIFLMAWLHFLYREKQKEFHLSVPENGGASDVIPEEQRKEAEIPGAYFVPIILTFAVVSGLVIYHVNVKPAIAGYFASTAHEVTARSAAPNMPPHIKEFREQYRKTLFYAGPYAEELRIRVFEEYIDYVLMEKDLSGVSESESQVIMEIESEIMQSIDYPKTKVYYHVPFLMMGDLYYALGKVNAAYIQRGIDILERGYMLFPSRPIFAEMLGRFHLYRFKLGGVNVSGSDYDMALQYFQKALTYDATNPRHRWNLAVTHLEGGNVREGFAEARNAEVLGYHFARSNIKFMADVAVAQRDYPNLIYSYRKALEIDPGNSRIFMLLAAAYAESGDTEAAKQTIEKVRELRPEEARNVEAFIKEYGLDDQDAGVIGNE